MIRVFVYLHDSIQNFNIQITCVYNFYYHKINRAIYALNFAFNIKYFIWIYCEK